MKWQRVQGVTALTDGRGLLFVAFRGRVYSIHQEFVWRMTFDELITDVLDLLLFEPAKSAPSMKATPVDLLEESPNLFAFAHGDLYFMVRLTNDIATVEEATFSVMKEVEPLVEQSLGQTSASVAGGLTSKT